MALLDEETTTAQIKGYLSNRKMCLDPYNKDRKKSEKEKPWYLKTMKELKEDALSELQNQKSILTEADVAKKISKDIVKTANKFSKLGIDLRRNPHWNSLLKILHKFKDGKASEQEKKFIEDVFFDEYQGRLEKYVADRVLSIKNVSMKDIKNDNLKREIEAFMKKTYPEVKLHDNFSNWKYLSHDLRDELKKEVEEGNVSFTMKHTAPSPSEVGAFQKIKPKAGTPFKRKGKSHTPVGPQPEKPHGEENIKNIERAVRKSEGGKETLFAGFASDDLKNIYKKVVDEILYSDKGYFDDLLKHLHRAWEEDGVKMPDKTRKPVDLKKAFKKYIDLMQHGREIRHADFSPAERVALMKFAKRADPSWHAEKALRDAEKEGEHSELERALHPFIRQYYKDLDYPVPEFYEDSGLVTDTALDVLSQLRRSSKEDAADYFAKLRSNNPKAYDKEKQKLLKIMSKQGFEDEAKQEIEMDKRREQARFDSDEEKKSKLTDRPLKDVGDLARSGIEKASNPEDPEKEKLLKKHQTKGKRLRRQKSLEKQLQKDRKEKERGGVPKSRVSRISFSKSGDPRIKKEKMDDMDESISIREIVLGIDGKQVECEPEEREWHTAELVYDRDKGTKKSKKLSLKRLLVRNDEKLDKLKSKEYEDEKE